MTIEKPVVIAGLGPVGAVLALALNQSGVPVVVAEQNSEIVEDQRAATMHPPTLEMLEKLGLTDVILERGLKSDMLRYWDRITRNVVADFHLSVLKDDTPYPFVVQFEHYKLIRLIHGILSGKPNVDIHFDCQVVGYEDRGNGELVVELCHSSDGAERREKVAASYLVGADGAHSVVRKAADIEFEGFTYPERFLKIMTAFDFGAGDKGYALRNFFSDPEEWCNLFKVAGDGPPGLWRVVFPVGPEEDEEEASSIANVQQRLRKFLPIEGDYPLLSVSIYNVHQRVAKTFRKGPVLLVGDAAHLNNPIGGMGMNGGIHDAINLAEKLADISSGERGEEALDLYSRQRRGVAVNYVQAQTIRNKKMLEERDPKVRQAHFDLLKKTTADPELARAYLRSASLIDSVEASYAIT